MSIKIFLRILATLGAAVVAACIGFVAAAATYDFLYVPRLVKKYPHDGQIGLAVFGAGSFGAFACAVIVLIFGTVSIVKTVRKR
jgi:hypothetical protein